MLNKRKIILDTIEDLMSNFLFYDRKEDERLGVGEIEQNISEGNISIDEIVDEIRYFLEESHIRWMNEVR